VREEQEKTRKWEVVVVVVERGVFVRNEIN
jgi:hypothetical protein